MNSVPHATPANAPPGKRAGSGAWVKRTARALAPLRAGWRKVYARRRAIAAVSACLAVVVFFSWLLLFLRPDTWRYYTDETTFRHLARDTEPRFTLWEPAGPLKGVREESEAREPAISPDGTRMVFTRGAGQDNANLFMSRWNGRTWGPSHPLRALNSPFNEVGPAFSRDGRFLFFATDRPGGMGGYDLWVSRWDGAEFAWPLPLSLLVNSPFDETGPEPSATDDRLFFSSNRPRRPLRKEEGDLAKRELREQFRNVDFDIYMAERLPSGATNRAVERALSMLYSLREGALTDPAVMKKLGGSAQSEEAVDRALAWLARTQETNGNWSSAAHGAEPGHDVATTAFALLAFYGRDERHDRPGKYRDTVQRAVQWLVRQHDPLTGDLRGPKPLHNAMYDHAIGALALAEAYGLTKDECLYMPAQSAIDFLCDSRNPKDGGWRYQPKQEGDLSVSGWVIMALKSAELTGLHVPRAAFEGVREWLKSVSKGQSGGIYEYQPTRGAGSAAMVATGYFCSQLMGLSPNTLKAFETAAYIRGAGLSAGDMYYAYYGTLASYQNQGPLWRQWRDGLHRAFLAAQNADGSWHSTQGHAARMGRVICTALIALSLQAHYRYTPLYGLGYEPAPEATERSAANEADLPDVPEYERAKHLEALSSPGQDLHVAATAHGDFLYFASDRAGGYGGLDLYRARVTREPPTPPVNLGPAINTRWDETEPALRMAGFHLIFTSNRGRESPAACELYSSVSRQVFRRHVDGALPAIGWMAAKFKWRATLMAVALLVFVWTLYRAGRRKAVGSAVAEAGRTWARGKTMNR